MRFATWRDAQSQSGCLSFGSLLPDQLRQSATHHRLVGRPSFGGQRGETSWPRPTSIRQNLWKSNQGSGHAQAQHQCAQPGCRGLNALSYAHLPNWSVKRTPILASKYWFPACFALRCRLPWALGPHIVKFVVQVLFVLYAAAVGVIGQYAAFDSADLAYPTLLSVLTSLSALSLSIAVLIVTVSWHPKALIRRWRVIFWLSVADLLIGLLMDASIPKDFNATDALWLVAALFVLLFLSPAYYCSYVVAYRNRGTA